MIGVTHVWFRSFRDELSLNVKYFIKSQESHVRFRRKSGENVADGITPSAAGRLLLNSNHAFSSEPYQALLLVLLLFSHF